MLRSLLCLIFLLGSIPLLSDNAPHNLDEIPVSYKGRFRPLKAAAKLWLIDFYGKDQIDPEIFSEKPYLKDPILLKLFIEAKGGARLAKKPLLYLKNNEMFGINEKTDHVSLELFEQHLNQTSTKLWLEPIIVDAFFNETKEKKIKEKSEITLSNLNLKFFYEKEHLILIKPPNIKPWSYLKEGDRFSLKGKTPRNIAKKVLEAKELFHRYLILKALPFEESYLEAIATSAKNFEEAEKIASNTYPVALRMQGEKDSFQLIASKLKPGAFFPLASLKTKKINESKKGLTLVSNYTLLDDSSFLKLQEAYLDLESAFDSNENLISLNTISENLLNQYQKLASSPYRFSNGQQLNYPSFFQLKLETIYYKFPLLIYALISFILAFILFAFSKTAFKKLGVTAFLFGLIFLGTLLLFRVLILKRPPVSNMDETLLFVPFVLSLASLIISYKLKTVHSLFIASLANSLALFLAAYFKMDQSLEVLPPVLNSNFWLTIHVLMVVSSYSLFILSGIAAHCYLLGVGFKQKSFELFFSVMKNSILAGTLLLISGTILGGVWAAESWGRFWDWDPKESWAFISSVIYLAIIHLLYFREVRETTLAFLAIFAMQSILFTWYGVNYILGTGLHSYGFGSGGETFFYLFVAFEALFILTLLHKLRTSKAST